MWQRVYAIITGIVTAVGFILAQLCSIAAILVLGITARFCDALREFRNTRKNVQWRAMRALCETCLAVSFATALYVMIW
ncbi:MAG: hypothetical protein DELT_02428 [Desulfovibrio sp.]